MSLFSKGINMKTNSSCAKNIPSNQNTGDEKTGTGFTGPSDEKH